MSLSHLIQSLESRQLMSSVIGEPVSEFAAISQKVRVGYIPGLSVPQISQLSGNIHWGDGSTTTAAFDRNKNGGIDVLGTHAYVKPGTFAVGASLLEFPPVINGVTAFYVLNLGTVTTTATVAATPAQSKQTAGKSFTAAVGKFNQFTLDITFTATIHWGDGVSTNGTISGGDLNKGNWTVTGNHEYWNPGTYIVNTYVYTHVVGSKVTGTPEDFVTLVTVLPVAKTSK